MPKKRKLSKTEPQAKCNSCLQWISMDEYFTNDFYCLDCVKKQAEFPLHSSSHFQQYSPQDRKDDEEPDKPSND